jgi:hypothetical protein
VSGGYLYYSSNSGQTWNLNTSSNASSWNNIYISDNGSYGIASANGVGIYNSSNPTQTWAISNTNTFNWTNVSVNNTGYAVASVYGGSIYDTSYVSTTIQRWQPAINAPANTNWNSIAINNNGNAIASIYGGGIYYSSDKGVTWTISNAPTNINWVKVALPNTSATVKAVAYTDTGYFYYSSLAK